MALHRELHRLSANGTYFLAYRDAAKSCKGLSHQEAHTITVGVLLRYGVVKILSRGEAGLNGAKAAEFRDLLSQAVTDLRREFCHVLPHPGTLRLVGTCLVVGRLNVSNVVVRASSEQKAVPNSR